MKFEWRLMEVGGENSGQRQIMGLTTTFKQRIPIFFALYYKPPTLMLLYLTKIKRIQTAYSKVGLSFLSFFLFQSFFIAQPSNDLCENATDVIIDFSYEFYCVEGTTKGAASDHINSPCDIPSFPTVWYKILTSFDAAYLNLHVYGSENRVPVVRMFSNVAICNVWESIENGNEDPYCFIGEDGHVEIIGLEVIPHEEYYLAISTIHPDGDDFELCVNTTEQALSCSWSKSLEVTGRSGGGLAYSPYLPGETVNICMSVNSFSAAGNGCQWFQGLVPVFGDGWNTEYPQEVNFNGNPSGPPYDGLYGTSRWDWFEDVDYHHTHPYLQVGDFDGNGTSEICNLLYNPRCINLGGTNGACCSPCWQDSEGTILPPGWFAYGINGTCPMPGPPVHFDWGDGNTCGSGMGPWEFCFTKKIENLVCGGADDDYSSTVSFYTFTDGEVGSWVGSASVCGLDIPEVLHLPLACFDDIIFHDTILPQPIPEISLCSGDTLNFIPALYTIHDASILYWKYNVYNENNQSGFTWVTDTIKISEYNTSLTPKVFYIQAFGHASLQRIVAAVTVKVYIHSNSNADFTFKVKPEYVDFDVKYDGPWTHQWYFGDGDSSVLVNPDHYFDHGGKFLVTHIVEGFCGIDTVQKWVDLPPRLPNALIEFVNNSFCVDDTILVLNNSTGQVDSVQWITPGATVIDSDSATILISYPGPGHYDVGLLATNIDGADTIYYEDTLFIETFPQANFTFEIYDLFVRFNYSGAPSDQVQWYLGDSIPISGLVAEKQFDSTGTFPCLLIASNVCGSDTHHFQLTLMTTGNSSQPENSRFLVNPNPASDVINIIYTGESRTGALRIYNSIGQLFYSAPFLTETRKLTVSLRDLGLASDLICLVLETSEAKLIRRVSVVQQTR